MQKVTTKRGNTYYVSFTDDCDDNVGGYFCQVYEEKPHEDLGEEIDYFVIHKEDIGKYNIEELVQNYVEKLDCELNPKFGTGSVIISICSNNVDVELYGDDDDCKEIAKLLNISGNLYINDKLSN